MLWALTRVRCGRSHKTSVEFPTCQTRCAPPPTAQTPATQAPAQVRGPLVPFFGWPTLVLDVGASCSAKCTQCCSYACTVLWLYCSTCTSAAPVLDSALRQSAFLDNERWQLHACKKWRTALTTQTS